VAIESQDRDVTHDLSISTGQTAYNLSVVFNLPVVINFAQANLNTGVAARIKRLPHPVSTVIPFALGTTEAMAKINQFLTGVNAYEIEGNAHGIDADTKTAFLADCTAIVNLAAQTNANFTDPDVVRN
jgi:hypothetical protein